MAQSLHVASNKNRVNLDKKEPYLLQATKHQSNAEKILNKKGYRYKCREVSTNSSQEFYKKTCRISNVQKKTCLRYPVIDIKNTTIPPENKNFNGILYSNHKNPRLGNIDIKNTTYFNIPYNGLLKSLFIDIKATKGIWDGIYSIYIYPILNKIDFDAWPTKKTELYYSFSSLNINVHLNQKIHIDTLSKGFSLVPAFTIKYKGVIQVPAIHKKEALVSFYDTCNNINKNVCVKISDECIEPEGTRTFSGINIYQPCWKYHVKYKCGYQKYNTCDELAQKCNFIAQKCIEEKHGYCFEYERTYKCTKINEGPKEIVCGGPNSIQFKQKIEKGSSDDFLKATSFLAGINEAGESLSKHQDRLNIFKGRGYSCGEGAIGIYDCCSGDSNFIHQCTENEKALQQSRDKKLAIFVGRYCSKRVLGVCIAHRQGWCAFDTKLSRIIQEQGRKNQLNISFGSGEHPNCSGITATQLQRIDFTRIDFSEFFQDIKDKNTLPNNSIANILSNKLKTTFIPEANKNQTKVEE